MADKKIDIFSLTGVEYAERVVSALGKGYHHAVGLYSDWFQKGRMLALAPWVEPQARALVQQIIDHTDLSLPEIVTPEKGEGAYKFLLQLSDALETESVVIPMRFGTTLCVSSQIGCRMGCAFCVTAKMGLLRSLSTSEIVKQLFIARHFLAERVRNVVFMGMGEPLDNFDAVMQAVKVLCCEKGFKIPPAKVTISTSGLVDKIYRLIDEQPLGVNLAVSVNAANDDMRCRVMPVNQRYNMNLLKEAMHAFCKKRKKKILIEYVLLASITDSAEAAKQLAHYLEGLEVTVNVIPYNPGSRGPFKRPEKEAVDRFLACLRGYGLKVFLRITKGDDTMSACGQLGNKDLKGKLQLMPMGSSL